MSCVPLHVLNSALAPENGAGWLVGGRFTAADLNVASVLIWITMVDPTVLQKGGEFPFIAGWLAKCLDRPQGPLRNAGKIRWKDAFLPEDVSARVKRSGQTTVKASL